MDNPKTQHLWLDMPFTIEGKWWPSFAATDADRERLSRHGTLTYTPSGGGALKLHHGKTGLGWGANLILGGAVDDEYSPKFSCHGVWHHDWESRSTTLHFTHVFRGFHLTDLDKEKFLEVSFSTKVLNNWVRSSGFDFKRMKGNKGFLVTYREEKGKLIKLTKSVSIKISKWAMMPLPDSGMGFGQIETKERINFHIRAHKGKGLPLSEVVSYVRMINGFFTLASMSLSNPFNAYVAGDFGYRKGLRGKMVPSGAQMYLAGIRHDDKWFETQKYDFLFSEEDMELPLKEHLKLWLSKYEVIRVPFALYESAAFGDDTTENKFLEMCQAIETFHRNLRGGTYLEAGAFASDALAPLLSAIPASLPHSLKMALRNRLKHGNEFSLRKRLADLLDEHSATLETRINLLPSLAGDIADARNYLTHRPNAAPPNRFNYLHFYSTVLRSIFVLSTLTEIGFSQQRITSLAAKCEWFRWLEYNAPTPFRKPARR